MDWLNDANVNISKSSRNNIRFGFDIKVLPSVLVLHQCGAAINDIMHRRTHTHTHTQLTLLTAWKRWLAW